MNETDRNLVRGLFFAHKYKIIAIVLLHVICVLAQVEAINILKPLMNEGVESQDMGTIMYLGWVLVLLTVIASVTIFVTSYLSSKIATAASEALRMGVMEAAIKARSMDDLNGGTTNTMTCLTADVSAVQRYVFDSLRMYLPMPFLMVILFYYTFELNNLVGLILIVSLSLIVLVTFMSSRRVYPLFKVQKESVDRVNALLRDKIGGARPIRAFNGFSYEEEKFKEASATLGSNNRDIELNNYYLPNLAIAFMWMFLVTIFVIIIFDEKGIDMAIEMILFMQYATYLVSTLAIVPYICVDAPRAMASHQRLLDVISSAKNEQKKDAPDSRDHEYALRIVGVGQKDSFGRKVMDDVSIDLRSGEVMSIIGPNGCGNSMLFSIALGFRHADVGTIYVDGMDVNEVDPKHVRDCMAYAGNYVHVFRGTLRYNLDPHGRRSDAEIMDMCRRIGLDSFVAGLPQGLDALITEDASVMSGGQKLLLVIARTLLRDVPLYVFDDCFYSLDPDTKARTFKTIMEVCGGRAVIFVMHDISTCRGSDSIVLMEKGRVLDRGTFDELRERSPLFKELCTEGQRRDGTWA